MNPLILRSPLKMFGLPAAAGGSVPTKSLDFEFDSSQTLNITSANWGAYDRAKFAISLWFNKETNDTSTLLYKGNATNHEFRLEFATGNKLQITTYASDGTTINGRLRSTASYSTGTWRHVLVHFDSANGTAGDRMKMWVDGSEVTAFDTDTNPTEAANTNAHPVYYGARVATSYYDGLIYQAAFFSGTLPDISTLYDAGSPLSVDGMTGLWSVLDVAGDDVTSDGVLAAAWTNTNTVVASATIP
jgi:hypothetical protein